MQDYVHGYSEREAERLADQAGAVRTFVLDDTGYRASEIVLEAGCGTGAQTVTIASCNSRTRFVSIDIEPGSLARLAGIIRRNRLTNVTLGRADIYSLPFRPAAFDHAFVCYVLEHLPRPEAGLQAICSVTKPGGTVTVIEGDHGSCYWYPSTDESIRAWNCLVEVQKRLGGDSLIGRRLYPLLAEAGLLRVEVSPRMIYIDHSRPELKDSFVRKTIIAMVEGVRARAQELGLIDRATWRKGIADLHHVADDREGTFCYTFFKARGIVK